MFHINNNNEAKPCRAKKPANCRFYNGENDSRHYENAAEAAAAAEKILTEEFGKIPEKKNKYSFLKKWRVVEKQFFEDYDGVPTRFFNVDLREKFVPRFLTAEDARDLVQLCDFDDESLGAALKGLETNGKSGVYSMFKNMDPVFLKKSIKMLLGKVRSDDLYGKIIQSMSAPKDTNVSEDEVMDLADKLGISDLKFTEKFSKGHRSWACKIDGKQAVITDDPRYKNLSNYYFRHFTLEHFDDRNFFVVSTRGLVGAGRVQKKTGGNLLSEIVDRKERYSNETKIKALELLEKVEDAQIEGNNFIRHKNYVKQNSARTATAWMDKKNQSKINLDLAKKSSLRENFRHIEIDDDVDPVEFADFERSFNEIKDKLPKIPNGLQPELRLRKLGRHKANGIYFPHKNTVAIDVRTSEAFIHEYSHMIDIAVKDNASLSKEFDVIGREYVERLDKVEAGNKADYYSTRTEIFARGMEIYAHERLGIDNRLLNPERMKDRFDYRPFQESPELKQRLFEYYDKIFEDD